MGAMDKFMSANKLFWDSSETKIDKIPDTYTFNSDEYMRTLEKYYSKYSIDMFDNENINSLFNFYPLYENLGTRDNSKVYEDLKNIQRNSADYVMDSRSYEKCLKKYYNLHGEDTEWLVKIFVERYDLDRFNIGVEDVLDDVHELMGIDTKLPSFKKTNNKSKQYTPNDSCADKSQATASFTLGRYFDVINTLKEVPPTDFNVIVLTSQSHLAVGNFVSAYNTLKVLFESNEPIYQLPYADKKKSFPLGYEIFGILKSLRINTWSDALKKEKMFPIMSTELGKIKNINHNEFGENCYYQISELSADIDKISIMECVDALVKAEMAFELSWNIDKSHYQLKAMYLDRLLSYFSDKPVDDVMELWIKGSAECLRMAELQ